MLARNVTLGHCVTPPVGVSFTSEDSCHPRETNHTISATLGKFRTSVSQRELTNSINKNHNLAHAERESHTNRERAGDDALNGRGNLNLVKCLAGTISVFRTRAST